MKIRDVVEKNTAVHILAKFLTVANIGSGTSGSSLAFMKIIGERMSFI
jgi:hypothetical protein